MRKSLRIVRHAAFGLLVGACAALAVLNVVVWRGGLVDDPSRNVGAAAGAPARQSGGATASSPAPAPAEPAPPIADDPGGADDPSREAAGASATVSITRTHGPCWAIVREGSPGGAVLYEGMLAPGRTLTFSRDRVWLRLGAVQNVRLALNGEPVRSVSGGGAVDLLATAAGVRPTA